MRKGSVLVGFANVLLFVAGSFLLFAGTKAIFFENIGIAVPPLTSALIFLLAATVDRFETLKGLGIEAKTRQLNQTLNEAEETLSRLREVAVLLAESSLYSICCLARHHRRTTLLIDTAMPSAVMADRKRCSPLKVT